MVIVVTDCYWCCSWCRFCRRHRHHFRPLPFWFNVFFFSHLCTFRVFFTFVYRVSHRVSHTHTCFYLKVRGKEFKINRECASKAFNGGDKIVLLLFLFAFCGKESPYISLSQWAVLTGFFFLPCSFCFSVPPTFAWMCFVANTDMLHLHHLPMLMLSC